MANRVLNFYAGPAALPVQALERAREELLDFANTGMSVMEISHRSRSYDQVHNEAVSLVRELLHLPDDFHVLLLQGGGNLQFAMLPMNFLNDGRKADYILTGTWAKRALKEARAWAGDRARAIASTEEEDFRRLPTPDETKVNADATYVHFTSNNTVEGTQWHEFPDTGGIPLCADMSSDLMWRPFDVSRFGLIYAGAQKNLGPSGLVVVIIRQDFLDMASEDLPAILQYKVHQAKNSLYNTPPCFSVYMLRNVLDHYKSIGGLEQVERMNRQKAQMLYSCIDRHKEFYRPYVKVPEHRSVMNVTFRLPSEELDRKFVEEAAAAGMIGLKGYRTLGGIRVSMYNANPPENIEILVDFMEEFLRRYG